MSQYTPWTSLCNTTPGKKYDPGLDVLKIWCQIPLDPPKAWVARYPVQQPVYAGFCDHGHTVRMTPLDEPSRATASESAV